MIKRGIFLKVFTYTTIFLILFVCVTVALFSQQFLSFYNNTQTEQLYFTYRELYEQIHGKDRNEILNIAQKYYESNQSFSFYIKDNDNNIVFSTPNIDPNDLDVPNTSNSKMMMAVGQDYVLCATNQMAIKTDYNGLISKSLLALACMLGLGIACAFIFARQMTRPIKQLANFTIKMANLEDVPPASQRRDELGELAYDVHAMYDKLKETISKLEDEILREREMEEAQRYFFSAASHELKTPIAATGILLEGMLENVGDYKDHPKYLRECIKMMDTQDKMISEILELVNLNDGKIIPNPEKLDLGCVVANLLSSFQTLAEASGKQIKLNIQEKKICLADKKMLTKVLSNVILNAVQNTPDGGEIRIWCEDVADQYRFCVLNAGTLIDKNILPKLFDPFYRVDKARSRKDNRSGLGLTIVQKTLEAMNIDFALENTDAGVLFWLDLPEV